METKATIKDVKEFFGMNLSEMKAEWMQGGLTNQDKEDLMKGIGNGTLTY